MPIHVLMANGVCLVKKLVNATMEANVITLVEIAHACRAILENWYVHSLNLIKSLKRVLQFFLIDSCFRFTMHKSL